MTLHFQQLDRFDVASTLEKMAAFSSFSSSRLGTPMGCEAPASPVAAP